MSTALEHVEALILIAAPIAGVVALVMDFSWTTLLLLSILLVVGKSLTVRCRTSSSRFYNALAFTASQIPSGGRLVGLPERKRRKSNERKT